MLRLRKPSDEEARAFVAAQRGEPFSYAEVGCTRAAPPPGFVVDHNRMKLGHGEDAFRRAVAALRRWEMFRLGWVELLWPDAPIEEGTVVGVRVSLLGLWSLNACRIVYTIDRKEPPRTIGFAYGTLQAHAESGEERFSVEWHATDDSVWYDILACSRPGHVLTKLGYPVARALQRRFARDSLAAMSRAVSGDEELPRGLAR
ncbi:MAG: DUF1990 family protein [Candidatus Binatia bacterium]